MTPDARLHRQGARQHGIVTWDQCLGAGLTPRQVEVRVKSGVLVPLHHKTYRFASTAPHFEQSVLAACLAGGGYASHRCAAALWGLRGMRRGMSWTEGDGTAAAGPRLATGGGIAMPVPSDGPSSV
jgi:hypothetical protein